MQPVSNRRDKRRIAFLAAPAFALALAACGGGESVSSSDTASAPAPAEQAADDTTSTSEVADGASSSSTSEVSEAATETTEAVADDAEPASSGGAQIQLLSAEEAIANAEVNQPTLQSADNVLDIETLAVGDGSVQTLRDVVDGDRPVLLWFFSPH